MRDIERSLGKISNRINTLEQEELNLRLKNEKSSDETDDEDFVSKLPQARIQRGAFLNQLFLDLQKFQPLNV